MRLADLLGSAVSDADGRQVGTVRDLRMRRDAAAGEIVVTGIVIGDGPLAEPAHRWGFVEGRARGPWLFRRLARRARSAARVVLSEHVAEWSADGIRLRPGARLRRLPGDDRR